MFTVKTTLRFLCSIGFGLVFIIMLGTPNLVWADSPLTPSQNSSANIPEANEPSNMSILPLTYAAVLTNNVPVYNQIWHPSVGITPTRTLGQGYLWVSLKYSQPITWRNEGWYWINHNEYVQAKHLQIYKPTAFQGKYFAEAPDKPQAWLIFNSWISTEAGVAGEVWLPRYTQVTVYETKQVGDWLWYRIGEGQWIEQRRVGLVTPTTRPEGVAPTDRWIEVNLYEQTLAAYEGDRMVYATLLSSGLPWWPTEQGLFRIWVKVKQAKMSGRYGLPDYYYLEDVPWTMYFKDSYALHTAYWHDKFGFPTSHGCINLSPRDAQWLFNWVTPTTGFGNWTLATEEMPGTWVWVHE